jgi:hypothetical protein
MTNRSVAAEQTSADTEKIRAAALDYMEGWYAADAARVERALHPDLVKRAYLPGTNGEIRLSQLSALALVQATRSASPTQGAAEVTVLDQLDGIASVRARMSDWVDYMHMVKVEGEWKIINILWELTPAARGGESRISRNEI